MKKVGLSLVVLLVFILGSCNEDNADNIPVVKNDLRQELLLNEDVKEAFKELTSDEKFQVWESKCNQLLTQDLPFEHKELIALVKIEFTQLRNTGVSLKLQNLAIKLAKITPEEDFVLMFSSLGDYVFNNKFEGSSVSEYLIKDLERSNLNSYVNAKLSESNLAEKLSDCTCRWTCHLYINSSTNCNDTSSGCGWFWMQECDGNTLGL